MKLRHAFCLALAAFLPLGTKAGETKPDEGVVRELTELEARWVQAENGHDAATLRALLDEKFIFIFGGNLSTRDEFVASVTSGPVDPTQTQALTDRTFLIDGDTAVLTETDTVQRTKDGKLVETRYRCTTTYIRRQGRWFALAEVMAKLAPAM